MSNSITLTLKDGTQLTGQSFGAHVDSAGEVVFNTGMVGYPESITDPSYKDQILVITYPLVGNYGIPGEDRDDFGILKYFESEDIHLKGVIVSEYSENHNHWQAVKSLGEWLKEHGVPGITGIDTRALTEKLRDEGSTPGVIQIDPSQTPEFYDPNERNLVADVSLQDIEMYEPEGATKHIAIVDCGMKLNILRSFLKRGIKVTRVPWNHDVWSLGVDFDGVFFSNGPGDPEVLDEVVNTMKASFERDVPVFGICLGSQIMGRAAGGSTKKMKFGHRSQNQPCIDLSTGRCYITSQNHGYEVDRDSLPDDWEVWFENANDKSVEGVRHKNKPWFAVQFHPEATAGPVDTNYLFDKFVEVL